MSIQKLRAVFVTALLAVCSIGAAHAQNTVSVNGANCPAATVTFGAGTIQISAPSNCVGVAVTPPTINASTPPGGNTGVAYNHTFTAGGSTPITWSVSAGTLPAGLSINAASGTVSGIPTAAVTTTSNFSVTASNAGGSSAALATSITISPPSGPPVIQNNPPTTATVGVAYTHQYTATGATGITYAVTAGALPPGLTLTAGGLLSGTPTAMASGPYPFTVTATNGTMPDATQLVTITVTAAVIPTITSFAPPQASTGSAYTFSFGATGTTPITWALGTGTLPAGLTLASNGTLSGNPTTAGTSMFTVQATNIAGTTTSSQISLTVITASLPIPPTADINNNPIPTPVSKMAKQPGAPHAGPNGGGSYGAGSSGDASIRGWAISPAYCNNTLPVPTAVWYHNIDFADYGGQTTIDYIDMIPNQALVYGFVPAAAPTGYGNIYITTGPIGSPATTFVTISEKPCDFDVTKIATTTACYTSVSGENGFTYEITNAATSSVCKLNPGKQYFLNLRFQDARPSPIGTPTQDSCAGQGSSVCGALLKIKKY